MDNKELFGKHGIKNTKQRNLTIDILKQTQLPLTAENIFFKLKETDSSICLSSVYRILEVFISKGLVVKSTIPDENKAVFELKRMEHKHHLVCVSCKKMIAIDDCPLAKYEKYLEKDLGFDITGHKLEIFGYCQKCREFK